MTCNLRLRLDSLPCPRTCEDCGLGPCTTKFTISTGSDTNSDVSNEYEKFEGRAGSWMIYDFSDGVSVHYIATSLLDVVKKHARQYEYCRIGFWPLGMEIKDAISWWSEAIDKEV